jgi:hypothetical protein
MADGPVELGRLDRANLDSLSSAGKPGIDENRSLRSSQRLGQLGCQLLDRHRLQPGQFP